MEMTKGGTGRPAASEAAFEDRLAKLMGEVQYSAGRLRSAYTRAATNAELYGYVVEASRALGAVRSLLIERESKLGRSDGG